jgi:hypothetical protein
MAQLVAQLPEIGATGICHSAEQRPSVPTQNVLLRVDALRIDAEINLTSRHARVNVGTRRLGGRRCQVTPVNSITGK